LRDGTLAGVDLELLAVGKGDLFEPDDLLAVPELVADAGDSLCIPPCGKKEPALIA
jgi:hypothetical protein